jgi:hypothetical protein
MSVLHLGLSNQAWAVAQLVVGPMEEAASGWTDGGFTKFMVRPWYNGRERGLTFMRRHGDRVQALAVFEHRIGDHIVVWEFDLPAHWWDDSVEPADLDDEVADEQWRNPAMTAGWGEVGKVAEHVMRTLAPGDIYGSD